MYAPNSDRILGLLRPEDRVLDIGGWARPFNRADYVLDQEPYERLSFPVSFFRRLSEEQQVQWLFWTDSFTFSEATIHGPDTIQAELAKFVATVHPYPRWRLAAGRALTGAGSLLNRAGAKVRRNFQ